MEAGVYNFSTQQEGNSFSSLPFVCSRTDSENVTTPMDFTGVDIRMQFKKTVNDSAIKTFTIGDGITVNDPLEGVFSIDEFINLKSYDYLYDILFTFPNGMVYTYLKGDYKTLPVITTQDG